MTADGNTLAPEPAAGGVAAVEELIFKPPFADHQTVRVQLAAGIVDDIGRPLANAERFPLEVTIDSYPPLAKFSGSFGILEANEGAVLPVTLRNVEVQLPAKRAELAGRRLRETSDIAAVAKWMQRVDAANSPRGIWSYDETQKRSVWTEQTADKSVFDASDYDRFVQRTGRCCRRRCTDAPLRSRWHSTHRPRLLRRRTGEPPAR